MSWRGRLSDDRIRRLEKLGFTWNSYDQSWEIGFNHLQTFCEREGHCLVPSTHLEDGYRLGQWVNVQRAKKLKLEEGKILRLNDYGFVWDVLDSAWETGFESLKRFYEREGHCRVPTKYRERGFRLGSWVSNQRESKSELSEDRLNRLEQLGFIWDVPAALWEKGFAYLRKFQLREGHCLVPREHIEEGFRLGYWIKNQRGNKEKLSSEQMRRLDEIGFMLEVIKAEQ